jgi:DNA-binding CsgD family transcriptional regulator/PAS domain-containing protein
VLIPSALAIIAFCICIYLAYIVLRIEVRNATHYLLISSTVALGLWNLLAYCAYNARTIEHLQLAFLLSSISMFVFVPLNNAFALFVSRPGQRPWWYVVMIFIPAGIFSAIKTVNPQLYIDFAATDSGWHFMVARNSIANTLWLIYAVLLMALCQVFLLQRLHRTSLIRERRQLQLLIGPGLLAWIPALLQLLLHDRTEGLPKVYHTPILMLPWVIGNAIAVDRYQLLRITPAHITKDILRSINDLVILVESDGTIGFMNEAALNFFGQTWPALRAQKIDTILPPPATGRLLPPDTTVSPPDDRRITVAYGHSSGALQMLDVHITWINDRFGDFLGYLLVGTVSKPSQTVMRQYGLTQRESEMVQAILNGWSYDTIADQLCISESTIKSHVTSIYRKMEIRNRLELIRLVDQTRNDNISEQAGQTD